MTKINGVPVSQGKAIGKVFHLSVECIQFEKITISTDAIENEKTKLQTALNQTREKIQNLLDIAKNQANKDEISILESYQIMLLDTVFITEIEQHMVNELINIESSLSYICDIYINKMLSFDDPYFQARADDFKQIYRMLIRAINGEECHCEIPKEDFILVAKELGPADISNIQKEHLKGFILENGNITSHAAIVSRALGIPMVSGIDDIENTLHDINFCAIDGEEGSVFLEPTEDLIKDFILTIEHNAQQNILEKNLLTAESITLDGCNINLFANIGTLEEVDGVIANNADGIGLFRTELLFMEKGGINLPTEEEQFLVYKEVLSKMKGKQVVFRTLDIGGDKHIPALEIPKEDNPYLGWRAIRYCLIKQDIFRTQIRAILRASVFGTAKIMIPMIISKEEVLETKKIVQEEFANLTEKGIECATVPVGIMIETPAAAVNAEELATVSDFFSIGTNDLTQYTLAVDRGNSFIADLYNEAHPAVLKLIQNTIKVGKNAGIPVSLCGEMAGNPEFTNFLLKSGLNNFSMSPILILKIKKIIRNFSH